MKRLFILALLVSLMLGALVAPAAAVPVEDLTDLGRYFPDTTPVFVSVRTDDAFLTDLDGLLNRVAAEIPGAAAMLPPGGLVGALDATIQQSFGPEATFANTIRTWMGDTAAAGVLSLENSFDTDQSNDDEAPFVLAVDITDRAAAVEYLTEAFAESDTEVVQEEQDGFTVFTAVGQENAVAVGDDVLFLGRAIEDLPLAGVSSPLNANATFTETVGLLPESDYNLLVFLDLGESLTAAMANVPADQSASVEAFAPLFENFPTQAIGATILDGRSLTLDFAQTGVDPSVMAEMGLPTMSAAGAIDPAFASAIPAGTPLVIMGTNLKGNYDNVINALQSSAAMGSTSMPNQPSPEDIEQALAQAEFAVRGFTGLDLQDDILSWMTGNFALYLRFSDSAANATSMASVMESLPVDFAFIVEATDPAKAAALVDGLRMGLTENEIENVTVSDTTIGSTEGVQISIDTPDAPFNVNLVLASNDEVFVLGTMDAVQAALAPDGGLDSDPAYQEALNYVLEGTSVLAYAAGEGLMPLVNLVQLGGGPNAERDAAMVEAVLNLLSSASITAVYGENNQATSRAVLTLPE